MSKSKVQFQKELKLSVFSRFWKRQESRACFFKVRRLSKCACFCSPFRYCARWYVSHLTNKCIFLSRQEISFFHFLKSLTLLPLQNGGNLRSLRRGLWRRFKLINYSILLKSQVCLTDVFAIPVKVAVNWKSAFLVLISVIPNR